MFKNSFWIHLKGTRGLYLPRAVTRIQKPAEGAGLRSSQEREGFLNPRMATKAEDPGCGPCTSLCLSLSLCSHCFNYWTPSQHSRKREKKEIENHID